jgi:hypothetical protein
LKAAIAAAVLLLLAADVRAQDPPKLIELFTHTGGAQADQQLRSALKQAHIHFIAARTVVGDLRQSVTLAMLPDFASIQKLPTGLSNIPSLRGVVLAINEPLSINIGNVPLAQASAYRLGLAFLRRGGTDDYMAEQQLAADLLRATGVRDEEFIAYMMQYGNEVPGALFVTPMRKLADIDQFRRAAHANPFSAEQDTHRSQVLRNTVERSEEWLVTVLPEHSYPPDDFVKANPALWRPTRPGSKR